jgi:hypothetical protein
MSDYKLISSKELSKEEQELRATNRCPRCKKTISPPSSIRYYSSFFDTVPIAKGGTLPYRARAKCQFCHQFWYIYAQYTRSLKASHNMARPLGISLQRPTGSLRQFDTSTAHPPPDKWVRVRIEETGEIEEPLATGSKEFVIDNLKSSASVQRTETFSTEWTQLILIEKGKIENTERGIGLKLGGILDFHTSAMKAVSTKYAIQDQNKRTHTETLTVNVPPKVKLRVSIRWKRVCRKGFVVYRNQDGQEKKVEFKAVIGITYDSSQHDVH